MILTYNRQDLFTIISLRERITPDTDLSFLEREITRLFSTGNKHIGVELAEESTLSSRAIGLLVRCNRMIVARGGTFAVIDPSDAIVQLFEILNIRCGMQIVQSAAQLATGQNAQPVAV